MERLTSCHLRRVVRNCFVPCKCIVKSASLPDVNYGGATRQQYTSEHSKQVAELTLLMLTMDNMATMRSWYSAAAIAGLMADCSKYSACWRCFVPRARYFVASVVQLPRWKADEATRE